MKALRLHGPADLRFSDEPAGGARPGERLLRVTAVGICGSDLHWFHEAGIGDARLERPLVLGHEFTALTEEGKRVAVDPAIPCGRCEFCLEGNPNLCESLLFAGHGQQDGALREQMAWPERCLFTLPDSISDVEATLLEPLGVAIPAVDLAHLKVGMRVGVFGCGPIGLLILQLARLSGASEIIATDVLPHRVEAARELGADRACLAGEAHRDLDVVFEAAGENQAVEAAVAAARPGAKVMLVGIPSDDRTLFTASIARRKGITLKLVRRMKRTYPRAIRLVENRRVNTHSLVTHVFPFDQAARAFSLASRREGLKVVISIP